MALGWNESGWFFQAIRIFPWYCSRSCCSVGSTRPQNGHWKSDHSTIVTGAFFGPSTGALPTSIYAALKKGVKPEKLYEALVAQNVQSSGQTEQQVAAKIEVGNAPVLGPKNAPVTIVEWSDFQCPFCGRVEPTLQQLREQYQGKIRIAWKNQPLSFHPNAMPAAEAAMAAHEQGKFWEFHDALFKKQLQLGPALYDDLARQLGLDMDRFRGAIQARKHAAHIQADIAAGNAVGAQGTPTFFINGKKLVGAQPIDAFKQLIEAELAGAVAKK